jgi:2-methylcitrate dehydratase PrpD
MTPLEILATWVSGISPASIPQAQHDRARLRLLDTLGLIAAAAGHPAGHSLAQFAKSDSGAGAHILTTGSNASAAIAALVHGSLAHARDFDDTFAETVVHPGSVVIAAMLAAAERADASFDAMTTAIAAGYEIAARLGAVAGRGFHARGFHATGIVGPIAATAAAGRIMALDGATMADAFGLATSMSGGLLAFLADGGWSKWLHTGWSAHGGVVAADLARNGFRGPRHSFDHRYGLYGAFLGDPGAKLDALTVDLGKSWLGATAQPKIYPCAHVIQPYIDAVLAMRSEIALCADTVQAIVCVMAPWALPIVAQPRSAKVAPRNDLEAIASLPFMVAAALCDGRVDLSTLLPETIARREVLAVASRIECEGDESLGAGFDGQINVALRDGRNICRPVTLADPGERQVVAKFRANTAHLPPGARSELEHAILKGTPGGRPLMRLALAAIAPRAAASGP